MESTTTNAIAKQIAYEFLPLLRGYTDGSVERLVGSPIVPPSLDDPTTGVSSKDITISPEVSARLFLPNPPPNSGETLPIVLYFHGGGFCVESAFSLYFHRYITHLVSSARVLAVSVEFRLAPENPLPAAYDDAFTALKWVSDPHNRDPWLTHHGNFNKIFIGGDATGANIAHNLAIRAGSEKLSVLGMFLSLPFFWGSEPIGSEKVEGHQENMTCRVWKLVYPSAAGGIDNPAVNPFATGAPCLSKLGCRKLLVVVAEKDVGKERGVKYCEAVRESGWRGEVELCDVEGVGHGFHIVDPQSDKAMFVMARLVSFLH